MSNKPTITELQNEIAVLKADAAEMRELLQKTAIAFKGIVAGEMQMNWQ